MPVGSRATRQCARFISSTWLVPLERLTTCECPTAVVCGRDSPPRLSRIICAVDRVLKFVMQHPEDSVRTPLTSMPQFIQAGKCVRRERSLSRLIRFAARQTTTTWTRKLFPASHIRLWRAHRCLRKARAARPTSSPRQREQQIQHSLGTLVVRPTARRSPRVGRSGACKLRIGKLVVRARSSYHRQR